MAFFTSCAPARGPVTLWSDRPLHRVHRARTDSNPACDVGHRDVDRRIDTFPTLYLIHAYSNGIPFLQVLPTASPRIQDQSPKMTARFLALGTFVLLTTRANTAMAHVSCQRACGFLAGRKTISQCCCDSILSAVAVTTNEIKGT